jgi:hypothetical protein
MNIQLAPDGAIHVKRFSWHTACGKEIDLDNPRVVDTSLPVTCGKCLSQRTYWHVGEIAGFGILIDRNEEQAKAVDELRAAWYPGKDSAEIIPYSYLIKVFSQFTIMGQEIVSMAAHLPDDEAALSLAETLVWFRVQLMCGNVPAFDWPIQHSDSTLSKAVPA